MSLSTGDLAWLIVAHQQFKGYVPFKDETIEALRELHHYRHKNKSGGPLVAVLPPFPVDDPDGIIKRGI